MTSSVNDSFVGPPMPGILESPDTHGHELAAVDENATPEDLRDLLGRVTGSLETVADYARTLWQQLTVVGDYLREDLARGPAGDGLQTEEQWRRWENVYATTLYVLAGPRGDNGYAADQARAEHRTRTEDLPATP